ncbi:hypothetical protein ACQKFL_11625 [Vreelandella titanicae]|uniref:hypothetical protein n=1 Tax=Vreelandella titanicae TaxID=664683 RepID=UPI003D005A93
MRYISARQMIFEAYHTRRGNSPIADLFDNLKRIREKVGDNGAKLRSLIAEHKRNIRALSEASPFDNLEALKLAVKSSERRLSEMRTALEDVSKSSNEGHLPDNDWKIVNGLEAGQVISAVERQPQHLQALARYCFGPFTRDELAEDRETVEIALYREMLNEDIRLPGQGKGRPTAQQLETLRYLCMAALHHHSEVTWPYSRQGLHSPNAVRKWFNEYLGAEIDVHYWSRKDRISWGKVWRTLLDRLDYWEYLSLSSLAPLVEKAA